MSEMSCYSRWCWVDAGRVRSSLVEGRGRRSDVSISPRQGGSPRMCLADCLGCWEQGGGAGADGGRRGRSGGVFRGRLARSRIRIWLGTFVCGFVCLRGRCGVGPGGFPWRGCRIAS